MRPNELPQENDLLATDLLAPVAPCFRHNRSMPEKKAERKSFVVAFQLTLRQTGAAAVSGLPADNSNCAWCASSRRAGSLPLGHHTNRPCDRRFCASQNPWPSYTRMRMDVPRRLRNTNRHPEKGSDWSFSWHNRASESIPFLPSTASI